MDRIPPEEAPQGANPELPGTVNAERSDVVHRSGREGGSQQAEPADLPHFRQEVEPAAVRAHPESAGTIFHETGDAIRRDARGVKRQVAIDLETVTAVPVESVQRPAPEETLPVLHHAGDPVLREAIGDGEPVKADGCYLRPNDRGKEKRKQEQKSGHRCSLRRKG
jgi:hypothetical protein